MEFVRPSEDRLLHKASISKRHERAEYWIRSAIELATLLLRHRVSVLNRLEPAELNVYERVSGELLSRTIWKYSEAHGKLRGNPFWSLKALDHFDEVERKGDKLFRHEHVFPQKMLIEMLRKFENPETSQLRLVYEKYAVAAVILKEEDALLHGSGRGQNTVPGGLDNPWLRYQLDNQQILIVENELIPAWHLEKLRAANLLFRLPSADDTRVRVSTIRKASNRKRAVDGSGIRRYYYDGPFPSPDAKLRFLVANNPKVPGTAAWARFELYLRAKPATVREFMEAGGRSEDIRSDLWHEYIALDPDPRAVNSDAPVTDLFTIQPAGRFGMDGHVVKGTRVTGKVELLELLKDWLDESDVPTIGKVGDFGGSPCIFISFDNNLTAVLNADTSRAAVGEYIAYARRRGANAPWSVKPNRRGRINKLTFRRNGAETPGWYCYLRQPLPAEREI